MEQKKSFYGWKLAVVLGIIYFCSSAFVLAAAQIVNPMMFKSGEIQMDATMLGMGFTLFVLCQGIPTPLLGQLIAKKGARFTMIIGGCVMLLGTLAMSFFVHEAWSYFLFFGVLMSMGSMALGQLSTQTVAGSWFIANRGKAMTIVMVIGGAGSILAPQIVKAAIDAAGGAWQAGWYAHIAAALIGLVLAVFLVKNTPASIGQLPDGVADSKAVVAEAKESKVYKNADSITYKKALKTPAMWLIALTLAGGYTAFSLNTSQGVMNFTQLGFDNGLIVTAVSVMGFAMLTGRLVVGVISDRFEPIRLMGLCGVMLFVAILLGAFATPSAPVMMFGYYILLGFFFGAINTVGPTALANYFGAGHYSKILSTGIMVTTIVSAPIATIVGATFDATGACTTGFLISAGIVAVCTICSLFVRLPKKGSAAAADQDEVRA